MKQRTASLGITLGVLLLVLAIPAVREVAWGFLDGALGGRNHFNLWSTMSRASVIVGMAMAVLVAFRAGLINLGGEGQLVLGGLTAAMIGVYVELPEGAPPALLALLALTAAMLVSGLWALFAGWLDRGLGIPLLVGSLLLNYPANQFASWLVSHPLRDVMSGVAQSHKIDAAARLPRFPGTIMDYGVFIVLLVVVLVIWFERNSVLGYRIRMHGYSSAFAKASGLPTTKLYYQSLFISGALAGLVGFIVVFGFSQRYIDGMLTAPLYAWTGVVAVLLASTVPWLVPVSATAFAILATGAGGMERVAGIPREVAQVIQGLVILWLAASSCSLHRDR